MTETFIKSAITKDKSVSSCFYCDCKTYPFCTVFGSVCENCFDIWSLKHKNKNTDNFACTGFCKEYEDIEPSVKTYDPINPKIEIVTVKGDGDCLYRCICKALPCNGRITIKDLRYLVAKNQNEITFECYKSSFPFFQKVRSLRGFQNLIMKCGEEVGTGNCIWGDENALQIISNEYLAHIAIFNEKGNLVQTILPSVDEDTEIPKRYVKRFILLLIDNSTDGNEHYYLLKFDNKRLISEPVWKKLLKIVNKSV